MLRVWPTWEQKQELFKRVGYTPEPQQEPVHRSSARHLAIFGGERAGKSKVTAMETFSRLLFCPKVENGRLVRRGRVGIVSVEYAKCRAEFDYITEAVHKLGFLTSSRSTDRDAFLGVGGTAEQPWVEVLTVSMANGPLELTSTGMPFDLILLVEAGLLKWDGYTAALGRLTDTRGSLIISGTLWEDFGWYADLWDRWSGPNIEGGERHLLRTAENRAIFPEGENEAELRILRAQMSPREYARRFEAVLLPSPARVYQEFQVSTHVRDIPFNPDLPVTLSVDAGYFPSAYAVLAAQFSTKQIVDGQPMEGELTDEQRARARPMEFCNIFEEVYLHRNVHTQVINYCKSRPWWKNVDRIVGGHEVGLHAAQQSTGEIWLHETGKFMEPAPKGVLPGVSRVRTWLLDPELQIPRLTVNPVCVNFIREARSYSRKQDSRGQVLTDEPADENNDAMDALRNLLVVHSGWVDVGQMRKVVVMPNPLAFMR